MKINTTLCSELFYNFKISPEKNGSGTFTLEALDRSNNMHKILTTNLSHSLFFLSITHPKNALKRILFSLIQIIEIIVI